MSTIIIAPRNKAKPIRKGRRFVGDLKTILSNMDSLTDGVYVRRRDWLEPAELADPPVLTLEQLMILTAIRKWSCEEYDDEFMSIYEDPEWYLSEVGVMYTTHEYEEDGWQVHDLQVYADVSDPEHPCLRVLFDWEEVYREEHTTETMLEDIEGWTFDCLYSWALNCVPDELLGEE